MGRAARASAAAAIGALCAAGWLASIQQAEHVPCPGDSGPGVSFCSVLVVMPAMALGWMIAAYGLLKLTKFRPAWPTAFAGPAGTVTLLVICGLVVVGMRRGLSDEVAMIGVIACAACGYALAAAVSADYRGRRDRTEHRGQDG